jgi:hypothetical protein
MIKKVIKSFIQPAALTANFAVRMEDISCAFFEMKCVCFTNWSQVLIMWALCTELFNFFDKMYFQHYSKVWYFSDVTDVRISSLITWVRILSLHAWIISAHFLATKSYLVRN